MATSPLRLQQGYGIGNALQPLPPFSIIANRAPTQQDKARIGTFWVYTAANNVYVLSSVTGGNSNWLTLSNGGAGIFTSLTVNGPSTFVGNITQTAGVTSLLATTTAGLTNNGNFVNNTGAVIINPSATAVTSSLTVFGQNTATQPSATFAASVAGNHNAVQFVNQNAASTGTCEITVITTNQDAGAGRIGDAQIRLTDTALGGFTLGKDASAGDFVISQGAALGTNDRLTIDGTTGAVNLPVQPCFNAFLTTNIAAQTGNGAEPVILFDTVSINVGTNYNAANGKFTAPVNGNYLIGASVLVGGVTALMVTGVVKIEMYDAGNNAVAFYEFDTCNAGAIRSNPAVDDRVGFQGQVVIPMQATHYVVVKCQLSGGAANSASYLGTAAGTQRGTQFYGQLIS